MNKSLIGIVLGVGAAAAALCAKIYYDERDQPEPELEDEPEEEFDSQQAPEEAYKEPDFTSHEPEYQFDESLFQEPEPDIEGSSQNPTTEPEPRFEPGIDIGGEL